MKIKKYYYMFLHVFFLLGIFYAFGQFITTPRIDMLERRLWAYESWIILSFYGLFAYLTITERELRMRISNRKNKRKIAKIHLEEFRRILSVNIILLMFPWGLFLLFTPPDLLAILRIESTYWRVLGIFSILGAVVYYFPLRFYKRKLTRFLLIFGSLDNLVAGLVLTYLFLIKDITLLQWSSAPLLFYFSYFFKEQAAKYSHIVASLDGKSKKS